jgi:hypothetical protein
MSTTIEDLITLEGIEAAAMEIKGRGDYEEAEALVLIVISALEKHQATKEAV